MNEVIRALKERRSIRSYRTEQVREEDLQQILEAATYAPSGMGAQPVILVAVQDPATIARLSQLNAAELTRFRRDKIGFIFQSFNLVPTLNVAENIELSAMVRRHSPDRRRLKALVKELDMESRLGAFPSELSGGQQQKVACARALLTVPD